MKKKDDDQKKGKSEPNTNKNRKLQYSLVPRTSVVGVAITSSDVQRDVVDVASLGTRSKVPVVVSSVAIIARRFELLQFAEGHVVHAVGGARRNGGCDVGAVALREGASSTVVLVHRKRCRCR